MRSRRALACVAALAIAFAAIADNAVVCCDEAPGDGAGACAEMPCHTPTLLAATAPPTPVLVPRHVLPVSVIEPASADAPPPPTPPPTTSA